MLQMFKKRSKNRKRLGAGYKPAPANFSVLRDTVYKNYDISDTGQMADMKSVEQSLDAFIKSINYKVSQYSSAYGTNPFAGMIPLVTG